MALIYDLSGFNARLRLVKRRHEMLYDVERSHEWIANRVAELSGVRKKDSSQVGRWLNKGVRPKRLEEIAALAMIFETDPGWLAFGDGDAPFILSNPPHVSEDDQRTIDERRAPPHDKSGTEDP